MFSDLYSLLQQNGAPILINCLMENWTTRILGTRVKSTTPVMKGRQQHFVEFHSVIHVISSFSHLAHPNSLAALTLINVRCFINADKYKQAAVEELLTSFTVKGTNMMV